MVSMATPSTLFPRVSHRRAQTVSKGSAVIDPRTGLAFAAGDPLYAQLLRVSPAGLRGPRCRASFNETIGARPGPQ